MTVNEAICKGCGACNAICPSGAATMKHYRDKQVYAQIEALTETAMPMPVMTREEGAAVEAEAETDGGEQSAE